MRALLGNTTAIRATARLQHLQRSFDHTSQRLSTGFRVNGGADDPAGLIASETLRSERAAIDTVRLGSSRARAAVATADQALGEVQEHLREVNRLLLASGVTGLADGELRANQQEIDARVRRINDVLTQTSFRGRPLFRGVPVETAAATPPGITFTNSRDVGAVSAAGSAVDNGGGNFTVNGSGQDIFNTTDEFHFFSSVLSGDATVETQVTNAVANNGFMKAGIMFRESDAPGSRHFNVMGRPDGRVIFGFRDVTNSFSGGGAVNLGVGNAPKFLRVTRTGDSFTGEYSLDGSAWTVLGSHTFSAPLPTDLDVGLALTSRSDGFVASADFLGTTVTGTVAGGGAPTAASIGERPRPDAGVLAGDPDVDVDQSAFVFSLGATQPRALAALRFEETSAADLGTATRSLLELTSGGELSVETAGATQTAQQVINGAMARISDMRGHAGRFDQAVVEPASNAAAEASLQLADAEATIREADVAAEVAERSRIDVLQQSARRAMQVMFDVSRQQVEELI